MSDLHQLAEIADQAVQIGHDLMKGGKPATAAEKTERDWVTDLDTRIEREIRAYLSDRTPEIGFLGEEEGAHDGTGSDRWILDPIDGTANFMHGIPLCAVSLALVRDDRPLIGVITAPFLGMRYRAIEGHGAYGNGARLRCSDTTNLAHSIISIGDYATGPSAAEKNVVRLRLTTLLAERVERIRMLGSAALDLAWVAEGRTTGTIILGAKPWDSAAGIIIAREAGAIVVDASGSYLNFESREALAANQHLIGLLTAFAQDARSTD